MIVWWLRRYWAVAAQAVWVVVFALLYIDFNKTNGSCLDECLGPAFRLVGWIALELALLPFFVVQLISLIRERGDDDGAS